MTIEINPLPIKERKTCPKEFSFGVTFSDHMFTQNFDENKGWHDSKINPYHAISLDPSAALLCVITIKIRIKLQLLDF